MFLEIIPTPDYNNRGLSYDNLDQYQRAIENYDKFIELDPNHATLYNNRGDSYRRLGEYQRAMALESLNAAAVVDYFKVNL